MLIKDLLDLVLPARCAGCETPGAMLCANCSAPLAAAAERVAPAPTPPGFPACHAVAGYDGAVRAALIAYKERGRRDLCRPLGRALAAAVTAGLPESGVRSVLLVPVPSRRRAVRQRGADTTRALAVEAARSLRRSGMEARVLPALRLCRATVDSAGLSSNARAANISGAMSARLPPQMLANVVVVVDDLLTTGATLVEAIRALMAAGAPVSAAAVVAATPRRKGLGSWHGRASVESTTRSGE